MPWKTRDGKEMRIRDMADDHLNNALLMALDGRWHGPQSQLRALAREQMRRHLLPFSADIAGLLKTLHNGKDCWFALHDALREGGHDTLCDELAELLKRSMDRVDFCSLVQQLVQYGPVVAWEHEHRESFVGLGDRTRDAKYLRRRLEREGLDVDTIAGYMSMGLLAAADAIRAIANEINGFPPGTLRITNVDMRHQFDETVISVTYLP